MRHGHRLTTNYTSSEGADGIDHRVVTQAGRSRSPGSSRFDRPRLCLAAPRELRGKQVSLTLR
jgi:hypothetical protein